jgi:hypothetical protein
MCVRVCARGCRYIRSNDLLDFAEEILLTDQLIESLPLPLRGAYAESANPSIEAAARSHASTSDSPPVSAPSPAHLRSPPAAERLLSPRQRVVVEEQRLLNAGIPSHRSVGPAPSGRPPVADPTTLRRRGPVVAPLPHMDSPSLGELPASLPAWSGTHGTGPLGTMPSGRGEWVAQAGDWAWVGEPVTRMTATIDQILRESA